MIHHTGNVVEGNSSPPSSSSSPPSSSIINDRRDVIAVANTTNDTNHHQDYEDAKIPRSSFSKGFAFFEKAPRNNHQALTLLSPKKSTSESTSKLSVSLSLSKTSKNISQQHRSLSPPPPSSSQLSSLLFSPTPPSSLSSPSTSPPKQPQRRKAATDRSSTYLLSLSSLSSSVSSESLPEDSAPLSLLLPAESRSFPGNHDKDSSNTEDDDDNEASFSEFNEGDGDVVGDGDGDGVDVDEETAVTPKVTAAVLPSSSEHRRRKAKKMKKKKKKKQKQPQNYIQSCATTLVTFSKKVRVRKIARLIDMNKEDKHATYYSHDEMVQTRNMLRATIRVINEDYQQQQRKQRKSTKREMEDSTTLTQNSEHDITLENIKEQQESVDLFCAAYNDKNCDCCRPIIQNNNNNNNDCSEDEDDDDDDHDNDNDNDNDNDDNDSSRKSSSGENNYQYHDNTFCLRGLEVEFPKGKQRRRRNKTIARDMVFEEQRYYNTKTSMNTSATADNSKGIKNDTTGQQHELEEREKKEGTAEVAIGIEIVEDPVLAIAEVYRIESIPALQRALEIGTNDAFIAHCIYNHNQQQQQQQQQEQEP